MKNTKGKGYNPMPERPQCLVGKFHRAPKLRLAQACIRIILEETYLYQVDVDETISSES